MPLLTIITVTYNAEKYSSIPAERAAGTGAVGQPDQVEHLVVDGASRDRTLTVAEKYREVLSLRITSEPDHGLYDAMNKGQARARGRYVWFLNAGDEVHDEQVLQRLLEAMRSQADVYYSDALFVRDDGSPVGLRSQVTPHALPATLHWRHMSLGMKVSHQAFLVNKELAPAYDISNLSADIEWEIVCLKRARPSNTCRLCCVATSPAGCQCSGTAARCSTASRSCGGTLGYCLPCGTTS